jgi:hypothetical protein
LGDEEARRRGTQKTVLERKAPPTFDVLVEQLSWREVIVHRDVAAAVDALLRGHQMIAELRERDEQDQVTIRSTTVEPSQPSEFGGLGSSFADDLHAFAGGRRPARGGRKSRLLDDPRRQPEPAVAWEERVDAAYALEAAEPTGTVGLAARPAQARGVVDSVPGVPGRRRKAVHLYPFGVSRERLEETARHLQVPVVISRDPATADVVFALKTYSERQSERMRALAAERKPIYMLRGNTHAHMQQALARLFDLAAERTIAADESSRPALAAMQEAEDAIVRMLNHGVGQAELKPQSAHLRRLQHTIAQRYNLESRSYGREPHRRVRIYAR